MKNICTLCFIALLITSCRNENDRVPDVPVDLYINTLDPQYSSLLGNNTTLEIAGGSRGIIIYHNDIDSYIAYDRHCTFEPSNSCAQVALDESGFFMVDTCCSSQFQIINGVPSSGPATRPLVQYNTSFDGNVIHIWN